jgi:hypothetical protein
LERKEDCFTGGRRGKGEEFERKSHINMNMKERGKKSKKSKSCFTLGI